MLVQNNFRGMKKSIFTACQEKMFYISAYSPCRGHQFVMVYGLIRFSFEL